MRLHFYHNCYVFNTSFMYFQVNLQHGSSSFSFSLTFGSGSINSRKKRLLIKRNMSNILRPYLVKWRMFGCGLLPVVLTSSLISSTSWHKTDFQSKGRHDELFLKLKHPNVVSPGIMPIHLSEVSVEVVKEDAEGLDVVGAVSNQNMTSQVTIDWGWGVSSHFVAAICIYYFSGLWK